LVEAALVERLVKKYGRFEALRGVSFRIEEGEFLGLLGPNGAGKTTTLRALVGALRITSGSVRVFGYDAVSEAEKVKEVVGVVPENPALFPELSVEDNLILTGRLYGLSTTEARERARRVSEELGLEEVMKRKYGELSRGFKRRADVAAAMMHSPRMLILDEPTSGLDVMAAVKLRESLRKLNESGTTIVLATHNISEAMSLAKRVVVLNKGEVVAIGPPSSLREKLGGEALVTMILSKPSTRLLGLVRVHYPFSTMNERELRVSAVNTAEAVKRVMKLAEAEGIEIVDLSIKEASWEDVFARLLRGAEERAQSSRGGGCGCGCGGRES